MEKINIYESQYKGEIKGNLRLNSVGVWELTLVALSLVISVITGIWFPYTQKPGRNLQLMQIPSGLSIEITFSPAALNHCLIYVNSK